MARETSSNTTSLVDGLRFDRDGIYRYRFMHEGMIHQGSTGFSDFMGATQRLGEIRQRLRSERRDQESQAKPAPTFGDAYYFWLKVMGPRVSWKSVQMMESHWRQTWHQWRDLDLEGLQPVLDAHYNKCRTKYAQSTMAAHFNRISAILKFSGERGLHRIEFDLPKIKVPHTPKLVLTEDQVKVFFAHLDQFANLHQSVMVRTMYYLGLREQESYRLRWSCYDDKHQTYTIDQQKSGEVSVLPVVEEMADWFARLPRLGTYMCPRDKRDEPHGSKYTTRPFKRAVAEMGLPSTFCHHRLRATLATVLVKKGVPLEMIRKLLRHASVETCVAWYIETDIQDMRSALAKLS
ncbi:tyrosine-type recombinase/integrase [Geothrix edaphica]|nr:tyrosine-type recombinase/integrase [Geothrix edaphica]